MGCSDGKDGKELREARLAEALRLNLRRRKAQARQRAETVERDQPGDTERPDEK